LANATACHKASEKTDCSAGSTNTCLAFKTPGSQPADTAAYNWDAAPGDGFCAVAPQAPRTTTPCTSLKGITLPLNGNTVLTDLKVICDQTEYCLVEAGTANTPKATGKCTPLPTKGACVAIASADTPDTCAPGYICNSGKTCDPVTVACKSDTDCSKLTDTPTCLAFKTPSTKPNTNDPYNWDATPGSGFCAPAPISTGTTCSDLSALTPYPIAAGTVTKGLKICDKTQYCKVTTGSGTCTALPGAGEKCVAIASTTPDTCAPDLTCNSAGTCDKAPTPKSSASPQSTQSTASTAPSPSSATSALVGGIVSSLMLCIF